MAVSIEDLDVRVFSFVIVNSGFLEGKSCSCKAILTLFLYFSKKRTADTLRRANSSSPLNQDPILSRYFLGRCDGGLLSGQEFFQFREGIGIHFGLHRTELRSAHGTKFGGFIDVCWQGFVVVFLGSFWIHG
jgi:hypothetical protein